MIRTRGDAALSPKVGNRKSGPPEEVETFPSRGIETFGASPKGTFPSRGIKTFGA